MKNLAGDVDCDIDIINELNEAGIPIIARAPGVLRDEVPYHAFGRLGEVVFTRAWYYWVVYSVGMPLISAKELYEDPVGRKDVRVAGHCGCPPPDKWLEHMKSLAGIYEPCVCTYHVDSQEGLNLLVAKIQEVMCKS